MLKILEKIENFFSGTIVYKTKKKPAQPTGGEESKPQQEESKAEEKTEKQK